MRVRLPPSKQTRRARSLTNAARMSNRPSTVACAGVPCEHLFMASSAGSGETLKALHLGWALAECHGRYLSLGQPHPLAKAGTEGRGSWLPLEEERSPKERAIEAEKRLICASAALDMRQKFAQSGMPEDGPPEFGDALQEAGRKLIDAAQVDTDGRAAAERTVGSVLAAWDRVIQDYLASVSWEAAAAYRLGRGLGEVYWALEFDETGCKGTEFVLGAGRLSALQDLLLRLSSVLHPLTRTAISSSLDKWGDWARAGGKANATVVAALADQHKVWQALLVEGVDPPTLVRPVLAVKKASSIIPIVKAYGLEVLLAIAGLGLLTLASGLVATSSHVLGPVLGILGLGGISAGAVQARAKTVSHGLTQRLQDHLQQELVNVGATRLPVSNGSKRKA